MTAEIFSLKLLIPIGVVPGLFLMVRCIAGLIRIGSPDVRERFAASDAPKIIRLPRPGRYLVSIIVPAFTFITGTRHFSARFAIRETTSGAAVDYHGSRFSVTRIQRTDMSGRQSMPLGVFDCGAAGEYEVRCLNPDTIRSDFLLEISPSISAFKFVPLILGTILSCGMVFGGMIFTIVWMAGKA